jgi:uncharacterized membrane protein
MAENATEQQDSETTGQDGNNGAGQSALSRLLSKEVLIPAAATAATAVAAGYAAKKAPEVKERLSGEAKEGAQALGREGAEGAKEGLGGGNALGALASGASKLMPGKGKGGKKKTRRLPIQRWTDVAVPVEEAFEQWTNFEDFPKFMHRVVKVDQKEENTVEWEEKIWFSRRQWQGEITDLRENDRVAWKTVSGTMHSGIVSFHKLDDSLTRVLVTVDFQPSGMIEKMASGLRFAKRAVQADLARFKAYVELGEAEGLEYEVAPEQSKQDEAKRDAEGETESRDGASASGGNGEAEREERERRRQERREALSSR